MIYEMYYWPYPMIIYHRKDVYAYGVWYSDWGVW